MKSVRLLAIANSFSVNCLQYAYGILHDLGVEDIYLGNLYIGGCSLETHCHNLRGNLPAYTYYTNTDGEWKSTPEHKMVDAIREREWDFVFTQQCSRCSGQAETYGDLDELLAFVKANVQKAPVYGWQMTWAYAKDTVHPQFELYNNSQEEMYARILNAVQEKILPRKEIAKIIPSGTAVQNAREALGDVLNCDGIHLNTLGCYIAGLCVAKSLVGLEIDGVQYAPEGISEEERKIAIAAANAACENPFAVTKI